MHFIFLGIKVSLTHSWIYRSQLENVQFPHLKIKNNTDFFFKWLGKNVQRKVIDETVLDMRKR